jgi:hypothetical protein
VPICAEKVQSLRRNLQDIQYGGSQSLSAAQRSNHVYEVRPRKDRRGVDLISDALLFGRLW